MKTCTKCLQKKDVKEFYTKLDVANTRLSSHCNSCVKENKKKHYELNKYTVNARWRYTISACKKKGANLTLEFSEYRWLLSKPCKYCKSSIEQETGIGLDRLDNSKGYEFHNVVPCCGRCNIGRQDLFSPEEWQVMIDALIKFNKCDVPVSGL